MSEEYALHHAPAIVWSTEKKIHKPQSILEGRGEVCADTNIVQKYVKVWAHREKKKQTLILCYRLNSKYSLHLLCEEDALWFIEDNESQHWILQQRHGAFLCYLQAALCE